MGATSEAILFSIPLLRTEGLREDARADQGKQGLDRAYTKLGITRVTSWLQHEPTYLTVLWEGERLAEAAQLTAVSDDPHFAKWRGLTRIYAGPEPADMFWEASRHRILSWSTGERAAEAEARVFEGGPVVDQCLGCARDIQTDDVLTDSFDTLNRNQGFTRVEVWHQESRGEDVLIGLWEAHDLARATTEIRVDEAELDDRVLAVHRLGLLGKSAGHRAPEILLDWRA